jgi:hypothetical protein
VPESPLILGFDHGLKKRSSFPPASFWLLIVFGSGTAFLAILWLTVGLLFSVGFSNTGGNRAPLMLSAMMTTSLFLLMATFGIAVAGLFGFVISLTRQRCHGRKVVLVWLWFWSPVTVLSCVMGFFELQAWAVRVFAE